jgi:hypothetical protein
VEYVARHAPHSEPTDRVDLDDEVFTPRVEDDGSPGRIIATMVGIVGILLLGSLFWSAVGALLGAVSAATEAVPVGRAVPTLVLGPPPTAQPATATPRAEPTRAATAAPAAASTLEPTQPPEPTPSPGPAETAGRAPWVLLPQPAPGSKVAPGDVLVEARGRGDAAIAEIRLELDGAALPASLEQRSDSIWRGAASARVSPGQHNAKATVVDERGRSGSFRWTFEAGP